MWIHPSGCSNSEHGYRGGGRGGGPRRAGAPTQSAQVCWRRIPYLTAPSEDMLHSNYSPKTGKDVKSCFLYDVFYVQRNYDSTVYVTVRMRSSKYFFHQKIAKYEVVNSMIWRLLLRWRKRRHLPNWQRILDHLEVLNMRRFNFCFFFHI